MSKKFKSYFLSNDVLTDNLFVINHHNKFLTFKYYQGLLKNIKDVNDKYSIRKITKFMNSYLGIEKDSIILGMFYTSNSYTDNSLLVEYIKNNNIKKVYFVNYEPFRILHKESSCILDSSVIEKYPTEVQSAELNFIKSILDQCSIDYEIYHCERNADILSKNYNFDIKYYDMLTNLFSSDYGFYSRFNIDTEFKYKLCCFNLRSEIFRSCIAALLYNEPDTVVTLNHRYTVDYLKNNKELPLDQFSDSLKEKIISGYSDILEKKLVLSWDIPFKDVYHQDFILGTHSKDNSNIIHNSFVNLVTETRFCSPMQYITEKTLRSMTSYRPFIILSSPYTLKHLKDLGFKTFDQWWDESYDNIEDHNQRFEAVYEIVLSILRKDNSELKSMLEEMTEVLTHNRQNVKNLRENMFKINN